MKDVNDISTKINPLLFSDVYDVSAEIGRGKFAVVKRCTHKTSGVEYAAKYLKKRRKGKDCKKEVLQEVHMLELAISHPHIISLVDVHETNHDLIIITDFARGGELFEYINVEGELEEKVTTRLMRQILDGISFLHANSIAHLDVKPQNILLTDALPHGDIKLCDFGLARLLNSGSDILEIIGTPDYVAPEVLDYKPLDAACDMWSTGVLTYVMLTGCSPFAGDSAQETFLNISQVNLDFPEELFENISKEAVDFIQSLLIKNPGDRLTAKQSLDHLWLQKKDPVTCLALAGSPSGQRRSVLATKDPEFHKPVKKSRCDMTCDTEEKEKTHWEPDSNSNDAEKENHPVKENYPLVQLLDKSSVTPSTKPMPSPKPMLSPKPTPSPKPTTPSIKPTLSPKPTPSAKPMPSPKPVSISSVSVTFAFSDSSCKIRCNSQDKTKSSNTDLGQDSLLSESLSRSGEQKHRNHSSSTVGCARNDFETVERKELTKIKV